VRGDLCNGARGGPHASQRPGKESGRPRGRQALGRGRTLAQARKAAKPAKNRAYSCSGADWSQTLNTKLPVTPRVKSGDSGEARLAGSQDPARGRASSWEDGPVGVLLCPMLMVRLEAPPVNRPDESKEALAKSLGGIASPRLAAGQAQSLRTGEARPPPGRHGFREGLARLSAMRARRIGSITRFADRLREQGILREGDELDEFFVAHRIQKYAYIASMLGARLDYKFDFLESGAHSEDLALDLHSHRRGRGGDDPFAENPGALGMLVDIVRERRDTRWLQMATFAIRDMRMGETRDEFVERMLDRRLGYTRRAAADAFERVHSHRGALGENPQ